MNKFRNNSKYEPKNSPRIEGNRLHKQYSYFNRDFDRVRVTQFLQSLFINHAMQLKIDYKDFKVILRGIFDVLRILRYKGQKYISFIELKTTAKRILWNKEILCAIKQLQLYIYMITELAGDKLAKMGYKIWVRHYVEIFSQKTGYLLRRVTVQADNSIRDWIEDTVKVFMGLKRMTFSNFAYCRLCPIQVRKLCSYYEKRKESKHMERISI